jgi:hypothetical protein
LKPSSLRYSQSGVCQDLSNGEEKLKSALDIALEKASKLGKMSDEEKREAREKELAGFGEALAVRYLKGLPIRDIELELARYKEDRQKVIRYMLNRLCDRLDLGNNQEIDNIMSAIKHFTGNSSIGEAIRSLATEYQNEVEKTLEKNRNFIEDAKRKELKKKGISGSAVVPAVESSPEWLQLREDLNSRYRKRLEELKTFLKAL